MNRLGPDIPRPEGVPEDDTVQRRPDVTLARRTTKTAVTPIDPAHEQTAWPRHERACRRRDR